MARFQVIFCDEAHDTQIAHFDTFKDAMEYWNDYADTPTCFAGEIKDLLTGEIIYDFDDTEGEN